MSVITIAIACGLFAAVAWGIADFFAAKASRSVGPALSVVAVNLIGLGMYALFYVLMQQSGHLASEGLWFAIAAGITLGIGQIAFFQALNVGLVSIVSPLSSAYPLFTTLVVVGLFQAQLSVWQLIGVAVIMAGIFVASDVFSLRRKDWRIGRGPLLAVIVAVSWGLGYAFLSQSLKTINWQTATFIQLAVVALVCCLALPLIRGSERIILSNGVAAFRHPFVIGAGIVQMLGMVVINVGLEKGAALAPVVTAISACYPVLTIFLALVHLKEVPRLLPLSGAALAICGVVILSLGG